MRVPVSEETERSKLDGGDPVLAAGIEHLRRLAFELLDAQPALFAGGTITAVVPSGWKPNTAGDGYTSPDLPLSLVIQPWTATPDTDPDAIMPNVSPDVRKAADLATATGTWSIYAAETGTEDNPTYNVHAVLVRDGQPYLVTATTTREDLAPLLIEFVLVPALRAFEVAP